MRRVWHVLAQGPLGFASGLPALLRTSTLTAWLSMEGVDTKTIGLLALASLPGNFKFVWAPFFDRYMPPFLRPKRGWILGAQVLLAIALFLLGSADPRNVSMIGVYALVIAFLAATQDLLVDGYRTAVLEQDEVGRGSAAYVAGYRIAMIVAGGVSLFLSAYLPWRIIYWCMAGLLLTTTAATCLAPEAPAPPPPERLLTAFWKPLVEFFGRPAALWTLSFVMLFKFGDTVAFGLTNDFLVKKGFTGPEIGVAKQIFGMGATIVGAGIGGLLLDRIGLVRALLWFGALQACANLGYAFLAVREASMPLLVTAIAVDDLCNGLGTAAFVACITSLCAKRFAVTQYALFTSAMTVLAHSVGAGAGYFIEATSWAAFFAATAVVGVLALALVPKLHIPPRG